MHQKASPNDFVCSTMILVDREVVYSVLTSFFFLINFSSYLFTLLHYDKLSSCMKFYVTFCSGNEDSSKYPWEAREC